MGNEQQQRQIEAWEKWQTDVPDDVNPALYWYMKGYNHHGRLGGAATAGDPFEAAHNRWLNSGGPNGLHARFPDVISYYSIIFEDRAERQESEPEDYVPTWAQ